MTDNPIERLRNKLTPYLTLVELLESEFIKVEATHPTMLDIFTKVHAICKTNTADIHQYLDHAERDFKQD